jgi:hypothetical protein
MQKYEYLWQFAKTPRQFELLEYLLKSESIRDAAEDLGISERGIYRTLQKMTAEAAKAGVSPDRGVNHQVPDGFVVKGTSTLYDETTGEAKLQWVKTQSAVENRLEEIHQAIFEAMEEHKGVYRPRKAPKSESSDLMTAYVLGDPHIGCYAHAQEAGENFDVKIAREDLLAATSRLIRAAPKTDRALIANLGDFFHADNRGNTTSRGTSVDVDTRWPLVLQAGCMLMVDLITMSLSKHPSVTVLNCIGNHDDHSSVMLSAFLGAYFHEEERVEVLPTTNKFHYVQHGKTLIGATHGDTVKVNSLSEIMATDQPEMWANAQHRYWYTGHIHHKTKQELRGCVVESFRTLAARDAWHMNSGYRSGRDMYCIVHDKEYGEVERHRCDIRRARSEIQA